VSDCFAALVHDMQIGVCDNQTILFWNTFYGEECEDCIARIDYHELPLFLHRYFEEDVQALDR
jgi:hypothetical protein